MGRQDGRHVLFTKRGRYVEGILLDRIGQRQMIKEQKRRKCGEDMESKELVLWVFTILSLFGEEKQVNDAIVTFV